MSQWNYNKWSDKNVFLSESEKKKEFIKSMEEAKEIGYRDFYIADDIYSEHKDELKKLKDIFIMRFVNMLENMDINIHYIIVSYNDTANLTDSDTFIISYNNKYGSIQFPKYGRQRVTISGQEKFKITQTTIKQNLKHTNFSKFGVEVIDGIITKKMKRSKSCDEFLADKKFINYGRKKKIELVLDGEVKLEDLIE